MDDGDKIASFIIMDQDHKEHNFHRGAECRFQQHTQNLGQLLGQFTPCKTQQIGRRNHSNVIDTENPDMEVGTGKMQGDGGGDERPEDVDDHGQGTGAAETHDEGGDGIEAMTATLAGVVDMKPASARFLGMVGGQFMIVAVEGFSLFGVGLGFCPERGRRPLGDFHVDSQSE